MKIQFIFPFVLSLIFFISCDKKDPGSPFCNEFTLNNTFTAQINEQWCLKNTDFEIKFGPFVEDSRCNVPEYVCLWDGQYVMAATINNGESIQDTFVAEHNWSDTLHHNGYQIILSKVYPELRPSMEPLPAVQYTFDIIVKQ